MIFSYALLSGGGGGGGGGGGLDSISCDILLQTRRHYIMSVFIG